MKKTESLPLWKQLMFALGQFGWSLTAFGASGLVAYFYFPPETGEGVSIPALIFQGTFFLIFTVLGLANFTGRFFDAITDPIIAGLSDRNTSRFGRRRIFMAVSALPFALFSVLIFFPPHGEPSTLNSVWVIFSIIIFYLFMTLYVMPYGALIAELGHTSHERLMLSTYVSVTWALGFAAGQTMWLFKDMLQSGGLTPLDSFRTVIIIFAAVGFVCMMLPVLFIDEKRYCAGHVSGEGTLQAVLSAFGNRDFLKFTLSDFCYFVSNTFLEMGIVYYVTILMKLEEGMTTTLMMAMFLLSFAFYPAVIRLTNRFGKKNMLLSSFFIQIGVFSMIPLSGFVPGIPTETWGWIIILIEAVPVAIFGIVPTAIIADIAKSDGVRTGNFKEAVFFGARSFMMKLAISFTGLILPAMLVLGKSVENDTGVRLTAVTALAFTIAGTVLLFFYRQENIDRYLKDEKPAGSDL